MPGPVVMVREDVIAPVELPALPSMSLQRVGRHLEVVDAGPDQVAAGAVELVEHLPALDLGQAVARAAG